MNSERLKYSQWITQISNQMNQQLQQLDSDLAHLHRRIAELETSITQTQQVQMPQKETKKKRRTADLVERGYIVMVSSSKCPYHKCQKMYGTEISLNLHIRLKHNGGSKIEREELAQKILVAKFKGDEPPKHSLNLPPNFIEEFCSTYKDFVSNLKTLYNKTLTL